MAGDLKIQFPKSLLIHVALLAIVMPALALSTVIWRTVPITLVFPAVVTVYASVELAWHISNNINAVVTQVFWCFCYVFFGIAGAAQFLANEFPWGGSYPVWVIAEGYGLITLGMMAFSIFNHREYSRSLSSNHNRVPQRRRDCVQSRLLPSRVLVGTLVCLVVVAYSVHRLGLLHVLFANRAERAAYITSTVTNGPLYQALGNAAHLGVYVAMMGCLYVALYKRRGRILWWVLAIVVCALCMIINNPISTARFRVGTIILSLYFILPWRRRHAAVTVYALLVGLVVVFPLADLFRTSNDPNLLHRLQVYSAHNPMVVKADFDCLQQVFNGIVVVSKDGLQFGRQLLGDVLFWFPRSLWPQKPIPTGQLIAERMGYGFTNLSSPLWIEFYMDGGWLLSIAGLGIYGFVCGRLDVIRSKWDTNFNDGIYLLVTMYASYETFLLRGALLVAIAYFSLVIVFWLIVTSVKVYRRRPLLRERTSRQPKLLNDRRSSAE